MPASDRNVLVSVIFRVAVSAALLLTAGAIFYALFVSKPRPTTSDDAPALQRVIALPAIEAPVRWRWEGFGTAQAMRAADVPARITSTVIERPTDIRPGRRVEQGELLVRLDDSDFARQVEITSQAIEDINAQLARLQVEEKAWTQRAALVDQEVELSRAEFERVRRAFESDAANQRELDQARQALIAAERNQVATHEELDKIIPRRSSLAAQRESQTASLNLARQNIERSTISSPMDGVLASVDVEQGESVQPGQRIARVVNLERIEVPLRLPSSARPHVQRGDEAILTGGGASPQQWRGAVGRISPIDDEQTRTMQVFVELQQSGAADSALAPGRFLQGTLLAGEPQRRWIVPRRSLSGDRVMLIQDGVVSWRPVTVEFYLHGDFAGDALPDQQWAVLTGAPPAGSMVVLDGSRALAEGMSVQPIAPLDDGSSAPQLAAPPQPVVNGTPAEEATEDVTAEAPQP